MGFLFFGGREGRALKPLKYGLMRGIYIDKENTYSSFCFIANNSFLCTLELTNAFLILIQRNVH